MRTSIVAMLLLVSVQTGLAAERPSVAVLPFGIAKDRAKMRWQGMATASSLTEKLRRLSPVRVVPPGEVLEGLQDAGIKQEKAAWIPPSAMQPLGRWVDTDWFLIGLVGPPKDRKEAADFLQWSTLPPKQKGTDIWIACRFVQAETGETKGSVYKAGRASDLFALQDTIVTRLLETLDLSAEAAALQPEHRWATRSQKAYKLAAEAELLLADILAMPEGKTRERKLKQAMKHLRKAQKADANYPMTYLLQSAIYNFQNLPPAAAATYEQAIELDPHLTTAYYGLAELAFRSGDIQKQTEILERAVAASPWDDRAFQMLGEAYLGLDEPSRALMAFEQAIQLHPDLPAARYQAGKLYLEGGQGQEAVDALEKAVELSPGEPGFHTALTSAYLETGRYDEAGMAIARAETLMGGARCRSPLRQRKSGTEIGRSNTGGRHPGRGQEAEPGEPPHSGSTGSGLLGSGTTS